MRIDDFFIKHTTVSVDQEKCTDECVKLRKDHGVTQLDIAKEMDVSVPYVCQMEKGIRPFTAYYLEALQTCINKQSS